MVQEPFNPRRQLHRGKEHAQETRLGDVGGEFGGAGVEEGLTTKLTVTCEEDIRSAWERHANGTATRPGLTLSNTIVTSLPNPAYLAARSVADFPRPTTTILVLAGGRARMESSIEEVTWEEWTQRLLKSEGMMLGGM